MVETFVQKRYVAQGVFMPYGNHQNDESIVLDFDNDIFNNVVNVFYIDTYLKNSSAIGRIFNVFFK